MNTQMSQRKETLAVRSIDELAPLIKEQLRLANEAAETAAAPYWLEAGLMLLEAKGQMPVGKFSSWCARHFKVTDRQLRRYMHAAKLHRDESTTGAIQNGRPSSTLEDYLKGSGHEKGSSSRNWHDPVKKIVSTVNLEALRQDDLNRKEEREIQHKLAIKLIDIGYKVLASELHPDKKGGSAEAMSRLNEVRARLKQYA